MFPIYGYGEKVWVNKLIMGARIYTDYDFDLPALGAFRMPGIRNIKAGNVAVFNCPYGRAIEYNEVDRRTQTSCNYMAGWKCNMEVICEIYVEFCLF